MNRSSQLTSAPQPLTLTAFTRALSDHINSEPRFRNVWVIAELSDFRMHGPHAYGQLIEKDAAGRTVAKMSATIWGERFNAIRRKFIDATGSDLATGMKLMLCLTATHSPAYGLSANIVDIDPRFSLGDMERLRREILTKLQAEGIYDANKRLPLVCNPQKIAVISAPGAAGYGDFMNQLSAGGFAFYPLLYPAVMQGDRTAPTVMQALDNIEMAVDFWDCVVIIRGGGATSDLNGFDNLELARRVATFPLPVIVGIGHERDHTVLDYIAHTRCKTPTAVAAFLIDRLERAEGYSADLTRRIIERTRLVISAEHQRMSHFSAMLPILAPGRINDEQRRLERLHTAISRLTTTGITRAAARLGQLATSMATATSSLIARQTARLAEIPLTLRSLAAHRIEIERSRLEARKSLIDVLDPQATLQRGYSITRIEGHAVRSIDELKKGSRIVTLLPDGSVTSEITSKKPR